MPNGLEHVEEKLTDMQDRYGATVIYVSLAASLSILLEEAVGVDNAKPLIEDAVKTAENVARKICTNHQGA